MPITNNHSILERGMRQMYSVLIKKINEMPKSTEAFFYNPAPWRLKGFTNLSRFTEFFVYSFVGKRIPRDAQATMP